MNSKARKAKEIELNTINCVSGLLTTDLKKTVYTILYNPKLAKAG